MFPEKLHTEVQTLWTEKEGFKENTFNYINAFIHKNYKIGMHSHEFYEINVVIKGEGRHYIEQKSLFVKKGDVFVIPPRVMHGYYTEEELDVYHILVKNDFIKRYKEELEETPGFKMMFDIEPYLRQATGDNYFLHLDNETLLVIKNELEKIHKLNNENVYGYQNALALSLILKMCLKMHKSLNQKLENKDVRTSEEIIRAMEYIQNNLEDKLTVDRLAKISNMSKSTFSRQFKNMLNMPPMEYVINCRKTKAKLLMEEGGYSKAEIAQLCGFYDSSHMDKYINK